MGGGLKKTDKPKISEKHDHQKEWVKSLPSPGAKCVVGGWAKNKMGQLEKTIGKKGWEGKPDLGNDRRKKY